MLLGVPVDFAGGGSGVSLLNGIFFWLKRQDGTMDHDISHFGNCCILD